MSTKVYLFLVHELMSMIVKFLLESMIMIACYKRVIKRRPKCINNIAIFTWNCKHDHTWHKKVLIFHKLDHETCSILVSMIIVLQWWYFTSLIMSIIMWKSQSHNYDHDFACWVAEIIFNHCKLTYLKSFQNWTLYNN